MSGILNILVRGKQATVTPYQGSLTRVNLTSALNYRNVTYHAPADMWIAVADGVTTGSKTNKYIYSTNNGASWAEGTFPVTEAFYQVCSNGSVVVALLSSGSTTLNTAYYSYDGINWAGTTTQAGVFGTNGCSLTVNSSGMFCAVSASTASDTRAMTSTNGITWTARTVPAGGWTSICWTGQYFVASAGATTTNFICRSTDGINWQTVNIPFTGYALSITSDGNGKVLTAQSTGASTAAAYSTDHGATWNSTTLPVAGQFRALMCVGNTWMVPRYNSNTIYTSTNLTSWTSTTAPMSGFWQGSHYSPNKATGIVVGATNAFVLKVQ